MATAHEAFDRVDGVFGIGDGLVARHLADEAVAAFGEADDGRRGAQTFLVGDDDGFAAFHDRHARVGGTEVDADDFAHDEVPLRDEDYLSEFR